MVPGVYGDIIPIVHGLPALWPLFREVPFERRPSTVLPGGVCVVRKRKKTTEIDRVSKTQRKRDSLELQSLGETLIGFKDSELEALNLPESLFTAIQSAKDMHQRGALRRQKQYIGRLMREVDAEPIRAAVERKTATHDKHIKQFHVAEQWRERILTQGEPAITKCVEKVPIDADIVRELAARVERAGSTHARKTARKALFRHLHTALGER